MQNKCKIEKLVNCDAKFWKRDYFQKKSFEVFSILWYIKLI